MSIKTSITIPMISLSDVTDPDRLLMLLTAFKEFCEELARKAQTIQEEIRTSAPTVNDLTEGEQVRATVGGSHYIYTKKGGIIYRWALV